MASNRIRFDVRKFDRSPNGSDDGSDDSSDDNSDGGSDGNERFRRRFDRYKQELGFDPALAAARSRSFRRTGTLAQTLDGTGDRFVDIDDSHTGALPQADSGTTTIKRRGRPPGSRNKKTLQTEAAIAGAMQALQAGGTQG